MHRTHEQVKNWQQDGAKKNRAGKWKESPGGNTAWGEPKLSFNDLDKSLRMGLCEVLCNKQYRQVGWKTLYCVLQKTMGGPLHKRLQESYSKWHYMHYWSCVYIRALHELKT